MKIAAKNYDAIDIGNYIIYLAKKNGRPVAQNKLNKLIYFVACEYLQRNNELLFKEAFAKLQFGAISEQAFHHFKLYGVEPIYKPVPHIICEHPLKLEDTHKTIAKMQKDKRLTKAVKYVICNLLEYNFKQLCTLLWQEKSFKKDKAIVFSGKLCFYSVSDMFETKIPVKMTQANDKILKSIPLAHGKSRRLTPLPQIVQKGA